MAKTLLQYYCLYILPFIFGMCMCGLEDETFIMVARIGTTKYIGWGRIVLARPPQHASAGESSVENTHVILVPKHAITEHVTYRNEVSVYTKETITGMTDEDAQVVLDELEDDTNNWTVFQIHGDPSEVEGNIHCTISALPGGTTLPNIFFWSPEVKMFGYMVDRKHARFLGDNPEIIQQLKESASKLAAILKMAVFSNYETVSDFFKVTIKHASLNISGGGYILDFTFFPGQKIDTSSITL